MSSKIIRPGLAFWDMGKHRDARKNFKETKTNLTNHQNHLVQSCRTFLYIWHIQYHLNEKYLCITGFEQYLWCLLLLRVFSHSSWKYSLDCIFTVRKIYSGTLIYDTSLRVFIVRYKVLTETAIWIFFLS